MASNSNCASCNSSMSPPCFGARTWPFTRSSRSSGGILRGDEGRRIWFGLFWPPPHRLSLRVPNMQLNAIIGIGSMYGIFAYICLKFMVNVGKYTIQDGSYGIVYFFFGQTSRWIISSGFWGLFVWLFPNFHMLSVFNKNDGLWERLCFFGCRSFRLYQRRYCFSAT